MGDAPKEKTLEAPGLSRQDNRHFDDVPLRSIVPRGKTGGRMSGRDEQTEIVCVGETLWDLHAPEGTPLHAANHLRIEPGGSAANVALHLVKLGVHAGVIGVVGDDPIGRALVERLGRDGVDVHLMQKMSARTGLVMLLSSPPGAVGYRASEEEGEALRRGLYELFDARIVHLASLLPSRATLHAMTRAARRARQEGSGVTVDANLRPRLWRDDAVAKTNPFEVLSVADVVKVSVDDLRLLGFEDPLALRKKLLAEAILIVTNGGESTLAIGPLGEVEVGVDKLDVPMTIGAGDAFMAGCLSELFGVDRCSWSNPKVLSKVLRRGNDIARSALANRAMVQP